MFNTTTRVIAVFLVVFAMGLLALPSKADDCDRSYIQCDYHGGAYAYFERYDYPMGKKYKVYSHTYYDSGCSCQRKCEIAVKCD